MDEMALLDRRAWTRLSRGLVGYGLAALAVGLIWVAALLWTNGRITGLRDAVRASVPGATVTAELTATALRDGATTAGSFRTSLDESVAALVSSAATITTVRADLSALEAQLRSVSILGARPLASPADAVGRIASGMDGLDAKLVLIADGLGTGRDSLAANARSLGLLGDDATELARSLATIDIERPFGEVQLLLAVGLLLCATSAFMPALAALWLGLWLRRRLRAAPTT